MTKKTVGGGGAMEPKYHVVASVPCASFIVLYVHIIQLEIIHTFNLTIRYSKRKVHPIVLNAKDILPHDGMTAPSCCDEFVLAWSSMSERNALLKAIRRLKEHVYRLL
jgi:hypothetical protein